MKRWIFPLGLIRERWVEGWGDREGEKGRWNRRKGIYFKGQSGIEDCEGTDFRGLEIQEYTYRGTHKGNRLTGTFPRQRSGLEEESKTEEFKFESFVVVVCLFVCF